MMAENILPKSIVGGTKMPNPQWINYRTKGAWRWVLNAIFNRYDRVKIENMSWGEYRDADYVLFESIFQLLCDFVEIELAHLEMVFHAKNYTWWQRFQQYHLPRSWHRKLSRELAMQHWEWECELKEPDWDHWDDVKGEYPDTDVLSRQAIKARKIRELYLWYRDVRPKRVDPDSIWRYDLHSIVRKAEEEGLDIPEIKIAHDSLIASTAEEERQSQEDTDMACEVIKIRSSMWT
jgi:hypothetical protein